MPRKARPLPRPGSLAALVRGARLDAGMTLAEVGERLDLANGNFIGMVERGERVPSDEKLIALADALDLSSRELIRLKYANQPRSAVRHLMQPPPPRYPYLRRRLLELCSNRDELEAEIIRGEFGTLEALLIHHIYDHVAAEDLQNDKSIRPGLRRRLEQLERRKRRRPEAPDPWWFEEEGLAGAEALTRRIGGWSFDRASMTLTLLGHSHSGSSWTIPLLDRSLRGEGPPGADPGAGSNEPMNLEYALRQRGLGDDDVDELLTLVEWKLARRRR